LWRSIHSRNGESVGRKRHDKIFAPLLRSAREGGVAPP
jgi:hypothetical protein